MRSSSAFKLLTAIAGAFLRGASTATTPSPAAVEPQCKFFAKVMLVQDVSYSFQDDIPSILSAIPAFNDYLTSTYPGSSLGLASFTDVPFVDVGFQAYEPRDYCWKLQSGLTTDRDAIRDAAAGITLLSGRDYAEASLMAVHHAAAGDYFDVGPDAPAEIIILSTDAPPHNPGDLAKALAKQPSLWDDPDTRPLFGDVSQLPERTVVPNDGDGVLRCGQDPSDTVFEDYVSLEQVADALNRRHIILAVLATTETLPAWHDISDQLRGLGVGIFVFKLNSDSSNLLNGFLTTIAISYQAFCEELPPLPGVCGERPLLDFVILQDITASFDNDLPAVRSLYPELLDIFEEDFEDPAFSLATFGDKPVQPYGSPASGDYCYKMDFPLSTDREALREAAASVVTRSGADWWECQLQAMMSAAIQEETGWRGSAAVVLKIIALTTDSGWHVAGDGAVIGATKPNNVEAYAGDDTDYPIVHDVAKLFAQASIMALFLVTGDVYDLYEGLAEQFRADGVVASVQIISDDSSNILDAISNGVDELCDTHLAEQVREWQANVAAGNATFVFDRPTAPVNLLRL